MWRMSVSGRIEKRQSWSVWDPKWSRRLPALIALPINGRTCENGVPGGKRPVGRPRSDKPKPWVSLGMSKSTWYEKKSKGEV
jgi:hypothetical protein